MAPYTYHAYTVATPQGSQDAFDARLNQTIFAAAFGLAGLFVLGMAAYVSYWTVGRCAAKRFIKIKKPPFALTLPARADARSKGLLPPMKTASPVLDGNLSPELGFNEKLPEGEVQRRSWWYSKLRSLTCATEVSPSFLFSRSALTMVMQESHEDERKTMPRVKPLRLPALARLRPRNPRCNFDMVGIPPDNTSSSARGNDVPRIVVEDLEPEDEHDPVFRQSLFNGITGDSDSESDTSVDPPVEDSCEKRPSVLTTTSTAPTISEDGEKAANHQGEPDVNAPSHVIPALNFNKPSRVGVTALFSNISHGARNRPKLIAAVLDKKQKPASPALT